MSTQLRTFVGNLLEANDALVSPVDPSGLEVVLPPEVQKALNLPEHGMLAFSSDVPEGWQRVMLESDWLERLGGLLAERGREVRLFSEMPMISALAHPERILEHRLRLNNAIFRLQGVEESWTRCVLHTFRYSAVSDEKREGVIRLGRNLASGGILDPWVVTWLQACREEGHVLGSGEKQSAIASCPESHTPQEWHRLHQWLLPRHIHEHLKSFLHGMQRRQQRDLERLHSYHADLRLEVFARLAAASRKGDDKLKEERQRAALRLESITREYHAKASDLYEKFAMSIRMERVQSLVVETRVFRFHILIKRRKGERTIELDWHPLIRQLEEPPCEAGLPFGMERSVCDDALHLVSNEGFAPCVHCEKSFCRACHPQSCPKCHHRWID
ncbi:MAG: hypothetical protein HQL74_10890 [Magnetococcales bacterium]|nr:hypothetical protein [Magnetococcales bacterium]MBF0414248.1 hypothetical protein [Magnetococcales bacterium]